MAKELPKIYAEKVEHDTNLRVAYTKANEEKKEGKHEEKLIGEKINDIFHQVNYVYKIDVILTLKEGTKEVTLVGRNKEEVITIDNEHIFIADILDIQAK